MPDRFEGHPVTDELLAAAAARSADDATNGFVALIAVVRLEEQHG